jgi:hypothetical protein
MPGAQTKLRRKHQSCYCPCLFQSPWKFSTCRARADVTDVRFEPCFVNPKAPSIHPISHVDRAELAPHQNILMDKEIIDAAGRHARSRAPADLVAPFANRPASPRTVIAERE